MEALTALSPLDGRYRTKAEKLRPFFSEQAWIQYRVMVELDYLNELANFLVFSAKDKEICHKLLSSFSNSDRRISLTSQQLLKVKQIEKTTHHDVKAVEYFLAGCLEDLASMTASTSSSPVDVTQATRLKNHVHFALTSQDVNNLALTMMTRDSIEEVIIPNLRNLVAILLRMAKEWEPVAILSHTHGQPASPTSLGKELAVFVERLRIQLEKLEGHQYSSKFGGAVGNFNAHYVGYPDKDWISFGDRFVSRYGLLRQKYTTQIDHYDGLSEVFGIVLRIQVISIDLCRDLWSYISFDYLSQRVCKGEVGSSTMPHKVNPIQFENAEGNFGLSNALLTYLSQKLPVSRMQRDLTDSTSVRNIGTALGYGLVGLTSLQEGLDRITPNLVVIRASLDSHWEVMGEAVQTVLRRFGTKDPYQHLKTFLRGRKVDKSLMQEFVINLSIPEEAKRRLLSAPEDYVGKWPAIK